MADFFYKFTLYKIVHEKKHKSNNLGNFISLFYIF